MNLFAVMSAMVTMFFDFLYVSCVVCVVEGGLLHKSWCAVFVLLT